MKKSLFISFILIYIALFIRVSKSDCTSYKCIQAGDQCGNGETCPGGHFCNTWFDIPVCVALLPAGETCTRDQECQRGLSCIIDSADRYCSNSEYKGYGEKCVDPMDCSRSLDCINGTCYRDQTDCVSTSCPAGKFCNSATKMCNVLLKTGKDCDFDYQCEYGSICAITPNSANKTCVAMYSKLEGQPCINGENTCDIGQSLGCVDGFCKKYNPDTAGTKACSSNSTCPGEAETCICNKFGGIDGKCQQTNVVGPECKTATLAYFDCIKDSGCPLIVDNPDSPSSCQSKECGKQKCNYEDLCFISDYQCNPVRLGYCPEKSTSSSLSIAFLLHTLLISFLLFI
ncbi:hypothetical protein DLAC_11727 [Tieghemostelium lacteum]|uniref:Dickkopf N-terminal cysteine-rich domain-containing protein n=1 Tax=Tieghemostelium lacteum TaxID=361077 RepID=A0A151Z7Q3_TIELA|nr:hypothetical protein DLAC_11727 [Tieghemostelium lacteum]|eukprot:KYQ89967.1 hypothetical protein DLAC_11727 [Tieghemostelium lacteum]